MASADPNARRTRYYQEFLTPALHRRFTRASGVLLVFCYLESCLIREKTSILWLFMPVGPAGVCALLLSLSSLAIFVLRVAHLHFGERNTKSPARTFVQIAFAPTAIETLAFYLFSAWWFSEVYVWSAPANLHWVVEGKPYERAHLNERAVYLRCHFLVLGVFEAVAHLYRDGDRNLLPWPAPADAESLRSIDLTPFERMQAVLPALVVDSFVQAAIGTSSSIILYALILRSYAWSWSISFVRIFWSVSRSTEPPPTLPFHYSILLRSVSGGAMLLLLWRMSNHAFGVYVATPPVKNKQPLTDGSKDPNGSLLTGFRSRKEAIREFAFWELYYISTNDERRRKSIFCEIDRKGGSTWAQILTASTGVIEDIAGRISDRNSPAVAANAGQSTEIKTLPRLSVPLKDGQVLRDPPKAANTTEAVEGFVGGFAKSLGDSSGSRPTQTFWARLQDALLNEQTPKDSGGEHVINKLKSIGITALGSQIAAGFRETFSRRAKVVILGSPRSDLRLILLSINSITRLVLAAVDEDSYGIVNKDVGLILRTFTNIIGRIDTFMRESSAHWSDVKFQEANGHGRHDAEIDLVMYHLRAALRRIIQGYEQYASDMDLAPTEVQQARRAAGLLSAGNL